MKYKFVNKRRYRYVMYPCSNAALCCLSPPVLSKVRMITGTLKTFYCDAKASQNRIKKIQIDRIQPRRGLY